MRLAFSTNAYMRFPFEEAAARIADLGYEGLELMADVPHAWPAGLLDGPKHAIRAAMERNGLAFSNVNAFMMNAIADHRQPYWYPSFIEPDPGYRLVRVHHHLVPGTGAIDFAEVIAAIRRTGYDGWLTVELYPFVDDPDDAARKAREVLLPLVAPSRAT